MRYSLTALALAAATFTQVLAVPSMHNHAHLHSKKEAARVEDRDLHIVYVTKTVVYEDPAEPTVAPVVIKTTAPAAVTTSAAPTSSAAPVSSAAATSTASSSDDSTPLAASALSKMLALGVTAVGENSLTNNGAAWVGSQGPYKNKFVNNAGEDLIVVIWGSWGSWVNVKVPQVTISIPKGSSKTVSFADGASGAWAAIYSDTKLVNGQISNTWGEYTFGQWGVYDVSREVNMNGHAMSIVGDQGCTSDMNTCVFVCDSGTVCTTGYSLKNCAAGSQFGAQTGVDVNGNGGASGGCGGMGTTASLITTFGQ